MQKYAVITFREAENTIDALFSSEKRLEVNSFKIHTDIAEAYENLTERKSEGCEAIVLSETMLVDLATRIIY